MLVVALMSGAMELGFIPDLRQVRWSGRAELVQLVALTSSEFVTRGEAGALQAVLDSLVENSSEVRSVGLRRGSGQLWVSAGEHERAWQPGDGHASSDLRFQLPIWSGAQRWGKLEVSFRESGVSPLWSRFESDWGWLGWAGDSRLAALAAWIRYRDT